MDPPKPAADEIDAWKDFAARHAVTDYAPGESELAFIAALADAVSLRVYGPHEALRKAFDGGVMRGRIEGLALAQKLIGGK